MNGSTAGQENELSNASGDLRKEGRVEEGGREKRNAEEE